MEDRLEDGLEGLSTRLTMMMEKNGLNKYVVRKKIIQTWQLTGNRKKGIKGAT